MLAVAANLHGNIVPRLVRDERIWLLLQAKVKTLTIDEVLASDPELGKRLHSEISEGKFIP